MPTVWVLQENGNHDLSPAAAFGAIRVVCPPGDRPFSLEWTNERLDEMLDEWEVGDYFVLTGDPLVIMALGAKLVELWSDGELVKFLKWDRRRNCYIEVDVNSGVMGYE